MSKKQKTAAKLYDDFQRANKDRKVVLASREGYDDVEKYRKLLKKRVNREARQTGSTPPEKKTRASKKVSINHIAVLDCSGSMNWSNGIQQARLGLIGDYSNIQSVDVYNLIRFGSSIKKAEVITNKKQLSSIKADLGSTALYDATYNAINLGKKLGGNCLIKVFTDGGENTSRINSSDLKKAMAEAEDLGMTVTFIGLESTISDLVQRIGASESNTLTYDGTTEGLMKSMDTMSASTVNYTSKANAGEDVSKGFYKELI